MCFNLYIFRYGTEWPNKASIAVLECKGLKGKRIEVLRKILEKAIIEGIWRQPSVVSESDNNDGVVDISISCYLS